LNSCPDKVIEKGRNILKNYIISIGQTITYNAREEAEYHPVEEVKYYFNYTIHNLINSEDKITDLIIENCFKRSTKIIPLKIISS